MNPTHLTARWNRFDGIVIAHWFPTDHALIVTVDVAVFDAVMLVTVGIECFGKLKKAIVAGATNQVERSFACFVLAHYARRLLVTVKAFG